MTLKEVESSILWLIIISISWNFYINLFTTFLVKNQSRDPLGRFQMSRICSCASRHQNPENLSDFLISGRGSCSYFWIPRSAPPDTPPGPQAPPPRAPRWFHFLCARCFGVLGFPSVTCFIVAVCFVLSACFLTCSPSHSPWKAASLPAAPPCWCSRARKHAPTAGGCLKPRSLFKLDTPQFYNSK